MSEQGIDFGAVSNGQLKNFKIEANQTYVKQGSSQYAPYSNVINGYYDQLINGRGNFTLCCPNFATSDSCYGPNTAPQPIVSLNLNPLPGCNNTYSSSSSTSPPQPQLVSSSSSSSSTAGPVSSEPSSSSTGGSFVRGDPAFVGLRGQSYQIHGIDGAVYNLISDRSLQLNSRFVFLTRPRACPTMPSTGKKSSACFAHDGSYLADIGLMTDSGEQLYVESGSAVRGFATVTLNDQAIEVGETVAIRFASSNVTGYASYSNSHELVVQVGVWRIELENSDQFVNLRSVAVHCRLNELTSHGLLGQTWQAKKWSGPVPAIEGKVGDYVVLEDELWGIGFLYNKFQLSSSIEQRVTAVPNNEQ